MSNHWTGLLDWTTGLTFNHKISLSCTVMTTKIYWCNSLLGDIYLTQPKVDTKPTGRWPDYAYFDLDGSLHSKINVSGLERTSLTVNKIIQFKYLVLRICYGVTFSRAYKT